MRNCFLAVEADEETVPHYVDTLRRRQPGLLDRLPARRLEVPARRRGVHAAAAVGGVAAARSSGTTSAGCTTSRRRRRRAPTSNARAVDISPQRHTEVAEDTVDPLRSPGAPVSDLPPPEVNHMQIVDADGHVAEGASLALRGDGALAAAHQAAHRRAAEPDDRGPALSGGPGPGAGCPPEHGLSRVEGINWSSPRRRAAGRRPRPHRHHGALSELRPLRAEPRGSRVRRRLRAPLQRVDRRLLPRRAAAACAASR